LHERKPERDSWLWRARLAAQRRSRSKAWAKVAGCHFGRGGLGPGAAHACYGASAEAPSARLSARVGGTAGFCAAWQRSRLGRRTRL